MLWPAELRRRLGDVYTLKLKLSLEKTYAGTLQNFTRGVIGTVNFLRVMKDSNSRPSGLEAATLPAELMTRINYYYYQYVKDHCLVRLERLELSMPFGARS